MDDAKFQQAWDDLCDNLGEIASLTEDYYFSLEREKIKKDPKYKSDNYMLHNVDGSINEWATKLFLSMCKELYTSNDNPIDLMWKVVEKYENFTLANEQEVLLDFIDDNWVLIKEE